MESVNLAGRAGRWSASHWKTAAFGWIALAIIAVVVGGAVGARQMEQWGVTNGESRRAAQILDQGNFDIPARESILVQSATARFGDQEFTAAVTAVLQRLAVQWDVTTIVSPLDEAGAGLVSRDRHSALIQFDVRGEAADAKDKITPVLAAIDEVQARHPGLIIE
jgi:hypothetical protein